MEKFKAAMIQMPVVANNRDKNLETARVMLQEAAKLGCKLAVLPECLDLGWASPSAFELSCPIPGYVSEALRSAARDNQLYLVAGITERDGEKVYNTAVLISDEGELLAKHRKINILTDVEGMYSVGDRLSVTDTPLGRIGIDICADNSEGSTVIAHCLARMGAQMILSPSAWAVPPGFDNAKTPYGDEWIRPYSLLSALYDITVAGVSNVGPVTVGKWQGWDCIGNSIATGPGGKLLKVLPHGVDAACIGVIEIEPVPAEARGTQLVARLREKGFPPI